MPYANPNIADVTHNNDDTMTVKLKNDTTINIKFKTNNSPVQKEDDGFDWIVYRQSIP